MLVLLSSQLARARRRKQLLLSCQFAYLEIAVAAVRAAEAENLPLILTLDTHRVAAYPPDFLLRSVLELARLSSVSVAVEVRTEPLEQKNSFWLAAGAVTVTPDQGDLTEERYTALLTHVATTAVAYGAEAVATVSPEHSIQQVELLINTSGAHAARFSWDAQRKVTPDILAKTRDLARALKVPSIADSAFHRPGDKKKLLQLGVSAITLHEELEEAYTAGLRTGLRNRSIIDPSVYTQKGHRAVEQAIHNYYHFLHLA
jgi:fructose/tagatose bisphosphate aldolase